MSIKVVLIPLLIFVAKRKTSQEKPRKTNKSEWTSANHVEKQRSTKRYNDDAVVRAGRQIKTEALLLAATCE